jgi:hypothetical protein
MMKNTACSATLVELAMPTVISGTPRAVSAGTSTASNPTPMRATTWMRGEASSSGLRYGVADSAMPAACGSIACNSEGPMDPG